MWVSRGISDGNPVLLFKYSPNRNTQTAKEFIGNYQGCIQTDGYNAYNYLDKKEGVVHAGCWAHARRKFKEVTDTVKKNKKKKLKKEILANDALNFIGQLYKIERDAKSNGLSGSDLLGERKEKSLPVLAEFKEWLLTYQLRVSKELLLGKAINYTLNQWERLIQFVDNSVIGLDNNLIENAIRPFAIGRKNWMFSNSVRGVNASAVIYSIIETAKANKLNPFWYLYYIFEKIPLVKTDSDYDGLMPNKIDKNVIETFKNEITAQSKSAMN
jgi:transposase